MTTSTARMLLVASAATAFVLAGCSATDPVADEAPSETTAVTAAPAEQEAEPTTTEPEVETEEASEDSAAAAEPAVEAPEPKGPWESGGPVPMSTLSGDEVQVPDAVGSRTAGETADGMTMYQENGAGSIGTIAIEGQAIDFYLQTMQNPVDYGDFICSEGSAWGGGPKCMIGLADGTTLSFQNSAGPDGSVEGSAQFAAEALASMNVQ